MYTQKLYRNGNSIAVTVPKEILKDLKLRDGSQVIVKNNGRHMTMSPKKIIHAPGVNEKFMKMVDDFMNDHEDVLEELASK